LTVFYFLFYFDGMQTHATASERVERKGTHKYRFNAAKDARNRKVRGLWIRGERYYAQIKVLGERSPRRIPLTAKTLTEAKEELAKERVKAKTGALPKGGVKPSLADFAKDYLDYHENHQSGRKARTVEREKTSLEQWKKTLGHVRIDKITKPMITAFVKQRITDGVTPRTANVDVIVLRSVLKSAMDEGYIASLPTLGIRPLKAVTRKRPTFTPGDFEKLVNSCFAKKSDGEPVTKNGTQLADYLRFLGYCGARCNEALGIRWEDVNFERKQVLIGWNGDTKNGEYRYVDFNADLEGHLRDMYARRAPDSIWLFSSPQRGEQDRPAKTFRESLKLVAEHAELKWIGFHDLRHFFTSRAVMSGIDFKTIAEWLGHKDGGMLVCKVYSHLLPDHRRQMAQRLVFKAAVVAREPEQTASAAV
jgi:integrase